MPSKNPDVVLREVADADLNHFFDHLRDPEAVAMASSTQEDPNDRQAFDAHWRRLRRDPLSIVRTITVAEIEEPVGHIVAFDDEGQRQVRYWVGRAHWGHGIASAALRTFLEEVPDRPIWARAARHNAPGLAVLRRNGFKVMGEDTGYAPERGRMIDEIVTRLA